MTALIARVVYPDRRRSHRRRIISRDVFGKPVINTRSTRSYDARRRLTRARRDAPANRMAYPLMPILELTTRFSDWISPEGLRDATPAANQSTWETYAYDAHGHRTRTSRSDGSTRIQIYSRTGQLLYTEDSGIGPNDPNAFSRQRSDYVYLGNKLIAQRGRPLTSNATTTYYHHTDLVHSAAVETDSYGIQTQRTTRMPYGAPYDGLYREGTGYAGHVTDTQTNLTYMQQRYYDPVALRFLSPDPVDVSTATGNNFNRYWYANNNPYRFIDPDGMAPCTDRADCARRLALADQARGRDGRMLVGSVAATAAIGAAAAAAPAAATAVASNLPRATTIVNTAAEMAAGDALGGTGIATGGVTLYRVVDDIELKSIINIGRFSPSPNGDGVKRFLDNFTDADALRKRFSGFFGGNQHVVTGQAPKDVINSATRTSFTDVPGRPMQSINVPSNQVHKVMCTGSRIARESC